MSDDKFEKAVAVVGCSWLAIFVGIPTALMAVAIIWTALTGGFS